MSEVTPPKNVHTTIWGRVRRFEDWVVGIRPGFGTGAEALKCFMAVESRSPYGWIIPGLGFVAALGWYALLCVWAASSIGALSMGGAIFRIFVLDYTLFFFGLVSGFSMARRWRANPSQVEELSLVPLTPSVMGSILAAGTIRTWWRYLALFAILETIICIPHVAELANALPVENSDGMFWVIFHPAAWLTIVAIVACPWILAWFHFESVRLAHWMFAVHALPRVPLARAGVTNFIAMTGLVIGLSGLGSAMTGMAVAFIGLFMAFLILTTLSSSVGEAFYFGYSLWLFASLVGAMVVLALKRVLVRQYEAAFVRAWLQYQWWGAGETSQPHDYPLAMRQAVAFWQLYYRMREEEVSDTPLHRRVHTQRYLKMMSGRPLPIVVKDSDKPLAVPADANKPPQDGAIVEIPEGESTTSDKS